MEMMARRRRWRLAAALLAALAWETFMDEADVAGAPAGSAPQVTLEVAGEYFAGMPMVVAVTIRNQTPGMTFYNLPEVELSRSIGAVGFSFAGADGKRVHAAASPPMQERPKGVTLRPGQALRMLVDVSELEAPLGPGRWKVQAEYVAPPGTSRSPSVVMNVRALAAEDAAEAARLRSDNDEGRPSWSGLLTASRHDPKKVKLSPPARAALAWHLATHAAVFSDKPIAQLDETALVKPAHNTPLASEAALQRLEILAARKDPHTTTEADTVRRQFPGLERRVDDALGGDGPLASMRRTANR